MNILFGVGLSGEVAASILAIKSFKFDDAEIDLMHVVESVMSDGSFPELPPDHPIEKMVRETETNARVDLSKILDELKLEGIKSKILIRRGNPVKRLIEYADSENFDLVVARSSPKSYYGSLFFGSVAKGLVIGAHQSILIIKNDVEMKRPLRVVFATDHSPYCDQCVDVLLQMAPKGIGELTVLTANEMPQNMPGFIGNEILGMADFVPHMHNEDYEVRNQQVIERLKPIANDCKSVVYEGHASDAMEQVMKDSAADILIVGAQGRGFFERIRLGSKSFYQIFNSPHHILVLRPKTPV